MDQEEMMGHVRRKKRTKKGECPGCGRVVKFKLEEPEPDDEIAMEIGPRWVFDQLGYRCEVCHTEVCEDCCLFPKYDNLPIHLKGFANEQIENIEKKAVTDEGYLFICIGCMARYERQYIDSIPVRELPLHIHTEWGTVEGGAYFKKRLIQ